MAHVSFWQIGVYCVIAIFTLLPHAWIQEFSSGGGGPGQSDKKAFFFFFFFFLILSLFYRSQMVNFKEIYHFPTFSKVLEGVQHFPWGSNFFQGGGGGGVQ